MKTSPILNFNYLSRVIGIGFVLIGLSVFLLHTLFPTIEQSRERKKLMAYQSAQESMEALVIGSSHSSSFHLPALGLKGFDFHDLGGDIEELTLKTHIFLDRSPNLKTVFIPASPATFALSQVYLSENYSKRLLIVASNTPLSWPLFLFAPEETVSLFVDQFVGIKKFRKAFDHFLISFFSGNETTNTKCTSAENALFIKQNYSIDADDDLFNDHDICTMPAQNIKNHGTIVSGNHLRKFKLSIEKEPNIVQSNLQRLIKLADRLGERQGQLILVMTPYSEDFYESTAIQSLKTAHLSELALLEKHPNITVYDFHDYFYSRVTADKNDYFYDSNHLSTRGAIEFSQALKIKMGL
ncbi:MAG: hypothetical protein Q9M50_00055 [Methylococcales bacterium]|nr:hypothetical protein [Methylococcales bacterium]